MFLFQKIEEQMQNHQDARSAVAEFVLNEKKNLHKYTISQIADKTFTSNATVVRFAKSLGYDGWRDFMIAFAEELKYEENHAQDIDANFPFSADDSTDQIVQNLLELQIESLRDTAENLNSEDLEKASNLLFNARMIVIYGLSPHTYIADSFRRKLLTIGKFAQVCTTGEYGLTTHTLNESDCAIVVSYSGNNKAAEPMRYIAPLKRHGVPIIGITSGGDNYIHEKCDIVFSMSTKERLYSKIANYSTEESLYFIFNVLFSSCFAKNYRKNLNFKISNARGLESKRISNIRSMQEGK